MFEFIPEGEVVDFSGDVFPAVLERGLPLLGTVVDGYWEDVGTLESYRTAHENLLDGQVELELPGFQLREGVWIGEGVDVSPDAIIQGPVLVGDNSRVEAGAVLAPYTVLGADVVVKADAQLERTVVHDHGYIGHSARLRGAVIGRANDIREHAHIEEGVVIGDECFVGARAIINPGVKIYPFKTVEAGALVTSSIVWESKGARTLFGRRGVRGLANVDITSEVAVRLAMAYGTALKKGSVVCTSRDTSRVARALKRAIIAGLNLSGVHVMDLELVDRAASPGSRCAASGRRAASRCGSRPTIPTASRSASSTTTAPTSTRAQQRKIERLLYREDFRRAFAADIGDIMFPPRALEFYTAALEASVDGERLRQRSFKVVLDYSFGAASVVMPHVLGKIGASVLAVNPYAATVGATVDDLETRVKIMGDLVRTSGSDLGLVFDPDGETAVIIDDEGTALTADQALLVIVELVCATRPERAHRAAGLGEPRGRAHRANATARPIIWTKLSAAHLMEVAQQRGIDLAASQEGGFIWPSFLPAYDAAATLAHLLDLLARDERSLSAILAGVPDSHIAHEAVPTPWERKGAVMREMVERAKDHPTVLVDGVKILYPDGWALVLPDPEIAVTHVWADAVSDAEARRLVAIHAGQVAELSGLPATEAGSTHPCDSITRRRHDRSAGASVQQ